jgi:hypothetical protein
MRPEYERRQQQFGFTEKEILWDRVGDRRFEVLLRDEATAVHEIEVTTNAFGEFLFVSVSRPVEASFAYVTFFGLGYHEGRDRWIKDEWFWYESQFGPKEGSQRRYTLDEVEIIIQERREFVRKAAEGHGQSERGKLFELIADFTDEDGAMAEMEDLSDWFDHLDDE